MGMFRTLMGFFRRDRRAAVALAMAVMAVPLFLAVSASMDISRVMTARAILQEAADSAAVSGAGAWQTGQSATTANSVATQAFNAYAAQITAFAPLGSRSPTVTLVCTGSSAQCGSGSYATSSPTGCTNYCVIVTASVTLANTVVGGLAPSTTISVTAGADTAFPPETVNGSNIPPSPGFGSAGDHSDIYAYAVTNTGANSLGQKVYDYGNTPPPNQNCSSVTGTIQYLPETNQVGATSCNYLFIADSESAGTSGAGGSITLAPGQPIAFTFIDDTGAHNYPGLSPTASTTQLVVSETNGNTTVLAPTYEQNGYSTNTYTTTVTTASCQSGGGRHGGGGTSYLVSPNYTSCSNNGNYQTSGSGSSTTALSGSTGTSYSCTGNSCTSRTITTVTETGWQASASCPDETLYGALSSGYGGPRYDNLDQYSSAPEVLGYPPTLMTNHPLVPFVSTAVTTTSFDDGHVFNVQAICPNYSTSGTAINATIASAYVSAIANYYSSGSATFSGMAINSISNLTINVYSTAFPGATLKDSATAPAEDPSGWYNGTSGSTSPTPIAMTTGSSDVYPPAIAGCTPATSAEDNGATSAAMNPWWNWNNSNSGNCNYENGTNQASYLSSGQASYSDCALILQPLGTSVPTVPVIVSGATIHEALMPDYYVIVSTQPPASMTTSTIVALDPIWDGQIFTDQLGAVITNTLGGIDSKITVSGSTVTDKDTGPTISSTGSITGYGFVPSSTNSYQLVSGTYKNDYVIVEQPAQSGTTAGNGVTGASYAPYDFNLPGITSSQCYDPQNNGNAPGSAVLQTGKGSGTYATVGDQNTGTNGIDHVANPQLGAIVCSSNPAQTYALYWNDLGSYEVDDLGYWNAEFTFTCPVPGSSSGGGTSQLFE
jgi:Flp pilus assembly protein TadG